jgi:hypothetical protein
MTTWLSRPSTRLLLLFGSLILATVLVGGWVALASQVPPALVARNLAAWLIGVLCAVGVAASTRRGVPGGIAWLAPLLLGACFLMPDLQGVHRWIGLGPIRLNAAMLVLPAAVVAFAAASRTGWLSWIPIVAALPLLVWQPDASQATALAVVVVVAAVRLRDRWFIAVAVVAAAIVAAADAWLQPDPLAPVPEVEGIVGLAQAISPLAAVALVALLVATALLPTVLTLRTPGVRLAGLLLSLLLLAWIATPFFGAFPVPFAGIGPSPILGAWLGIGLLAGLIESPTPEPKPFKTVARRRKEKGPAA